MTDDLLFPAERARAILAMLEARGRVASNDLAAHFGVSEDSIRRDLRELAAQGQCKRVYGGAVRTAAAPADFDQRVQQGSTGKAALAAGACALLQPGQVVFLDAGTTNLAIAQRLPEDIALTLITNSPPVAIAAGARRGVQVQLIGGRFSAEAACVVGAEAMAQLQRQRFDVCIPGACAVDIASGVWANDAEEAALKRLAIANSARVIITATSEKLGTEMGYHVAALSEIDDLVVEASAPPAQLQAIAESAVTLHQARA